MKVVLTEDIKNVGRRGDVKNVKNGYARNYLLPHGLAKIATSKSIEILESKKIASEKRVSELKTTLDKIAAETKSNPITLGIKVGDKGEVFGSVMSDDIKKEIIKRFPELKGGYIEIKKDHLREVGQQTVDINLGEGIEGEIIIVVQPQQS